MFWALILTWASCAFASGGEIRSSFASSPGEFAANHGVTLAELADHSLLACWYAGSREGSKDVQIYCRRQIANGTWLERTVAVAAGERTSGNLMHNKTVGNPALYRDIDGVLWLFYSSVRIGGWAGGHVNFKTSHDDGVTWSDAKIFIDDMGSLTRSTPVAMPGGRNRFIVPLYHEFLQHNGFTCVVDARDGRIVNQECQEIPGDGAIQPSLVWHKKQLYAFLRDREKASVRVARFNLGKLTWDKAQATNLPNPNSSVAAISAGEHILLAFNNHASERSPLTLALSDDALHFQPIFELEPFGENKEYSYPSLIHLKSGDFRVGYTYDYRSAIKVVELNRWPLKTLMEEWQHR